MIYDWSLQIAADLMVGSFFCPYLYVVRFRTGLFMMGYKTVQE